MSPPPSHLYIRPRNSKSLENIAHHIMSPSVRHVNEIFVVEEMELPVPRTKWILQIILPEFCYIKSELIEISVVHEVLAVFFTEPDRDPMLLRIDGGVPVGEVDLEELAFDLVSGGWSELCLEDLDR